LPLVGTFHTLVAHPQYRAHIGMSRDIFGSFSWAYARSYYNRCDLITVSSGSIRTDLLEHKFKEPIKMISNGIDLSKVNKIKKEASLKKTILFVGRIAYEKNVFFLLECFKEVLKKSPDVKLLVVGDGPQMKELKRN